MTHLEMAATNNPHTTVEMAAVPSIGRFLTLCLSWVVITALSNIFFASSLRKWPEVFSVFVQLLLVGASFVWFPRFLSWSLIRLPDVGVLKWLVAAAMIQGASNFFYPSNLGRPSIPVLIAAVALVPIVEETICRGVLLRYLSFRISVHLAVAFVSLVAALLHPDFYSALITEVFLCVVYFARNYDLVSVMLCHFALNAVALGRWPTHS